MLHRGKDNQSSEVLRGCSNLSFVLQVFVECAGKTLRSSVIQKYKSNPNFPVLVDSIELVRSWVDITNEEILCGINVALCQHSYLGNSLF